MPAYLGDPGPPSCDRRSTPRTVGPFPYAAGSGGGEGERGGTFRPTGRYTFSSPAAPRAMRDTTTRFSGSAVLGEEHHGVQPREGTRMPSRQHTNQPTSPELDAIATAAADRLHAQAGEDNGTLADHSPARRRRSQRRDPRRRRPQRDRRRRTRRRTTRPQRNAHRHPPARRTRRQTQTRSRHRLRARPSTAPPESASHTAKSPPPRTSPTAPSAPSSPAPTPTQPQLSRPQTQQRRRGGRTAAGRTARRVTNQRYTTRAPASMRRRSPSAARIRARGQSPTVIKANRSGHNRHRGQDAKSIMLPRAPAAFRSLTIRIAASRPARSQSMITDTQRPASSPRPPRLPSIIAGHNKRGQTARPGANQVRRTFEQHYPRRRLGSRMGNQPKPRARHRQHLRHTIMARRIAQYAAQLAARTTDGDHHAAALNSPTRAPSSAARDHTPACSDRNTRGRQRNRPRRTRASTSSGSPTASLKRRVSRRQAVALLYAVKQHGSQRPARPRARPPLGQAERDQQAHRFTRPCDPGQPQRHTRRPSRLHPQHRHAPVSTFTLQDGSRSPRACAPGTAKHRTDTSRCAHPGSPIPRAP